MENVSDISYIATYSYMNAPMEKAILIVTQRKLSPYISTKLVNNTYKPSTHVEANIFGIHYWHVKESNMKAIPKYRHLKLGLEVRFIETWKCRSGVGRFKVSRGKIPKTIYFS